MIDEGVLAEFRRFIEVDKLLGAPGTHIKTFCEMHQGHMTPWLCALYVSVYNVPAAEVIARAFPSPDRLDGLELFLSSTRYAVRSERLRPVGSPTRLAACLRSAARWAVGSALTILEIQDYEIGWWESDNVLYFGRYAKLKLLEALRQAGLWHESPSSLLSRGAHGPRQGLTLIVPDETAALLGSDDAETLAIVDAVASSVYDRVSDLTDWYGLQVALCDYASCKKGRYYPGSPLDRELELYCKIDDPDGDVWDAMWRARARLFPARALGEHGGWGGVREHLRGRIEV